MNLHIVLGPLIALIAGILIAIGLIGLLGTVKF